MWLVHGIQASGNTQQRNQPTRHQMPSCHPHRLYADTYVYDFGWSDVSTVPSPSRRSLSFDLEPSYSDLNAYVQRVCPVLPSP